MNDWRGGRSGGKEKERKGGEGGVEERRRKGEEGKEKEGIWDERERGKKVMIRGRRME